MTDRAAALRAMANAVEWAEYLNIRDFALMGGDEVCRLACDARHGSLDACARLQAEVLPGYEAELFTGPNGSAARVSNRSTEIHVGAAPDLPRAWLAAQLRALAAKEG